MPACGRQARRARAGLVAHTNVLQKQLEDTNAEAAQKRELNKQLRAALLHSGAPPACLNPHAVHLRQACLCAATSWPRASTRPHSAAARRVRAHWAPAWSTRLLR